MPPVTSATAPVPNPTESRDQLAARLRADGVDTRTFFCPMNQQPCLRKPADRELPPCPVAEGLWETGLYLPSSPNLPEATIAKIAQCVRSAARSVPWTREQLPRERRSAA